VDDLFVERSFDTPKGKVLARFERPYLAPGGAYRWRWRIIGLSRARSREAAGIDGIQALMLAMRTVHAELTESAEYKRGQLTYLAQADLDLPPMWGSGSLYDAGSPPPD
jgi:hypothetical protein